MKALLQRVSSASVSIAGVETARINHGLLIFLGVMEGDHRKDAETIAEKIAWMRIFQDAAGKMNLSLLEIGGAALVVSQFTLCADLRSGRRPSFTPAAAPLEAKVLYEYFVQQLRSQPKIHASDATLEVKTGEFGATMQIELINDGPVTFILDSSDFI